MRLFLRKKKVKIFDDHVKNTAIKFYDHWKHSPLRGQPTEILWELFINRQAKAINHLESWGFPDNEVVLEKE